MIAIKRPLLAEGYIAVTNVAVVENDMKTTSNRAARIKLFYERQHLRNGRLIHAVIHGRK